MRVILKNILLPFIPAPLVLRMKWMEVILRCYYFGWYYEKEAAALFRLLRCIKRGVYIDVGANLGQYTLPLSKQNNCTNIISIEPQNNVFRLLQKCVNALGLSNIQLHKVIVADKVGVASLQIPKSTYLSPQEAYMVDANAGSDEAKTEMSMIDFLVPDAELKKVAFMKVDVEGAEFRVIRGAENVIEKSHPIVMLELVDAFLARYGDDRGGVIRWMTDRGYNVYWINNAGRLEEYEYQMDETRVINYVFIPDVLNVPELNNQLG